MMVCVETAGNVKRAEEQITNTTNFANLPALVQVLFSLIFVFTDSITKDQVLLAQLVDWPPKVPASSTRCEWRSTKLASTVPKPSGYFVLMPSEQRYLD